ncbi:MAG: DUF1836 domain-containing protein [Firmicutes bacterium]|nr:DUF1836 domain-containing protein [Bacillota bacterium]MBQ6088128.1 DUF1836 domain-containing protein [Bacillota bacterium]MBQ6608582.1 DUF1836 domain-containing protein [Bacillota bacterium]
MEIDDKIIDQWTEYWKDYIGDYELPAWDTIPDLGLYMEQVVIYLKKELKYLDKGPDSDDIITASAINNYVRKKFMPQPIKKRYYRTHLAYLLILCALKPSLSISEIQTLLPMDTSEDDLHLFYDAFRQQHKLSADLFLKRIERLKKLVAREEFLGNAFKDPVTELIVDVALISSFTKILSDKLFLFENTVTDMIGSVSPEEDGTI